MYTASSPTWPCWISIRSGVLFYVRPHRGCMSSRYGTRRALRCSTVGELAVPLGVRSPSFRRFRRGKVTQQRPQKGPEDVSAADPVRLQQPLSLAPDAGGEDFHGLDVGIAGSTDLAHELTSPDLSGHQCP